MGGPNRDFRPDPERSIFVNAVIDQALIDRLTPQIIALQAAARDPITVYIDSPGGSTMLAGVLERLLRASNQDFAPPCRLITVVTAAASSAAADLLSAGDYAIAYQDSTVHYHGVRTAPASPMTREVAAELSQYLRVRNDSYALALARKSIGRIIFLHQILKGDAAALRQTPAGAKLSELDGFLTVLSGKLGPLAAQLVQQARKKNAQHDLLMAQLERTAFRSSAFRNAKRTADREAVLIKALVDFERKTNPAESWTFRRDGLSRIADDFLLLIEFIQRRSDDDLNQICDRWSDFVLSDEQKADFLTIPEAKRQEWKLDKLRPYLQPLWFFCVSLCQALQEGENELTAEDAYWLGLVDEVNGARHLPSMRVLVEFRTV